MTDTDILTNKDNILTNKVDILTNIGDSILQHGKLNNRIYLMKLSEKDFPSIIQRLDDIAESKKYSKIFAKIPEYAKDEFINNNYITEARIPAFYNGTEDLYFMGKFFDKSRNIDNNIEDINKILYIAKNKIIESNYELNTESKIESKIESIGTQDNFKFGTCQESHSYQMADVYRKVFKTYPFPIFDPEYIKKTMKENFKYFFISDINNKIIALSSSEMDMNSKAVEMTDFATLPEFQGKGLAIYLLQKMEDSMRDMDMRIAYTISRSLSYGINIIFAKMGYRYGGLLLNNTNICGNFESMNVWYKNL